MIPIFAMCIPIVAMLLAGFKRWADLKEKQFEKTGELTAEKTAQYAAQTARLEERVRVLERIATDRGASLADEIEALRAVERPIALPTKDEV